MGGQPTMLLGCVTTSVCVCVLLPQFVVVGVPSAFILVHYFATGDRSDLVQALLSLSLTMVLTGVVDNTLKVCVGRSAHVTCTVSTV